MNLRIFICLLILFVISSCKKEGEPKNTNPTYSDYTVVDKSDILMSQEWKVKAAYFNNAEDPRQVNTRYVFSDDYSFTTYVGGLVYSEGAWELSENSSHITFISNAGEKVWKVVNLNANQFRFYKNENNEELELILIPN